MREKWKYLSIIITTLFMIFAGKSITSMRMINDTNSVYKINPEAVHLADELLCSTNDSSLKLFLFIPETSLSGKYFDGGTINDGIIQYSSKIDVFSFTCTAEYWENYFLSDITPDGENTVDYMMRFMDYNVKHHEFDYIAIPTNDIVNNRMVYLGYSLVFQIDEYTIYQI